MQAMADAAFSQGAQAVTMAAYYFNLANGEGDLLNSTVPLADFEIAYYQYDMNYNYGQADGWASAGSAAMSVGATWLGAMILAGC
jgi:hypothetical protein